MKKFLCFAFLASIIAISAAAIGKTKSNSQFLFAQVAKSASLTPIKNQSNVFQLTLNNVNGHVIWFTDRPKRNSGMISIDKFLTNWTKGGTNGFAIDPPNASLVTDTKEISVFKLANPVYDQKSNSLTYTATPVGAVHPNHLSQKSLQGEVALFAVYR